MMKLGKETGSLVNYIYGNTPQVMPLIGEAATMLGWSDRYPGTVVEVFKKGKFEYFVVQMDNAKRLDKNGFSESQEYEYSPNPKGAKYTFRVRNGVTEDVYLKENGRYVKGSGRRVRIGTREMYWDPCF